MVPSSRSSDPDRENFEPSRQSGFWEEISVILPSRHWQVPHRPPPSPLDETGLPLFRTLKPLSEDDQASSPLFSIRMLSSHINMITVCFLLAQRSNPGAESRGPWVRLIPLSQVTATMAQADVLEASEAGRTFLVARLAAIPIWRPIGALLTHRGPKGGIEYPGTAG